VKFAALEGVHKRLVMLGLMVATAAGAYGLSCAGLVDATTCDQEGMGAGATVHLRSHRQPVGLHAIT
jgi:hypothetical protein